MAAHDSTDVCRSTYRRPHPGVLLPPTSQDSSGGGGLDGGRTSFREAAAATAAYDSRRIGNINSAIPLDRSIGRSVGRSANQSTPPVGRSVDRRTQNEMLFQVGREKERVREGKVDRLSRCIPAQATTHTVPSCNTFDQSVIHTRLMY